MSAFFLAAALALSPADALDAVMAEHETFQGHIVFADGETIVAERVYGDAAPGRAMTTQEIWRWSSVTKQMLSVLIMQQVEAGALSLDDTIADRLPDFEATHADAITLRDLLRHTSGLPDINYAGAPPNADLSSTERLVMCRGNGRPPGGRFVYNNCDSIIAGAMLEAATSERWDVTLVSDVFEPAGMDQSGVFNGRSDPETVRGFSEPGVEQHRGRPNIFGAGAAVYGPAIDLVRFNAALMDGRLVDETSRETLWESDASNGYVALGAWSHPASLEGCTEPVRLIERHGNIGNHTARNFLAPELGRSVVVLTNLDGVEFGQVWARDGLAYALVSAAFCSR